MPSPPFVDASTSNPLAVSEHDPASADDLRSQATSLLPDAEDAGEIVTGYARGVVPIQADQTHYSDGFALLRGLPQGTAVALRLRADASDEPAHAVFAPDSVPRPFPPNPDATPWVRLVHRGLEVCRDRVGGAGAPVDVAVASSIPASNLDGYHAALAIALARAACKLPGADADLLDDVARVRDDLLPALTHGLVDTTGLPSSIAFPLATHVAEAGQFCLVDTATREYLPVQTDAEAALGWALIDLPDAPMLSSEVHQERRDRAEAALHALQANGFEHVRTFRELEHRDLDRAVRALPEDLGPVARHLVTENRRVQKHVAALRRGDWQMVGALLLMSQASLRDAWGAPSDDVNRLVRCAENLTLQGVYGAGMTSRGGSVLVTGRKAVFPDGLQQLVNAFRKDYGDVTVRLLPA